MNLLYRASREMKANDWKQNILNSRISLGFKVGISVSLTILVIGLILIGLSGSKINEPLIIIGQLPQAILNLDPHAIVTIAVLILLLTPISQIIIALVTLLLEKDRIYSGICLLLLCIIAVSIITALI